MLEIYKEQFVDLLKTKDKAHRDLKLMTSTAKGTYVEGLTSVAVSSHQQIMDLIKHGLENRHTGQTKQNQQSSRSHSIFMIEVLQHLRNNVVQRGVINLVDLAGSERVSKSAADGLALEEAKKINQSLSALGKVINSISKNKSHVPYRDSKLTRLLQESLGGNNQTTLIVCCSMHSSQSEETLSTLRFAHSAKMIQNKVRRNQKQDL